jgi:hypothetical protein
MRLSLRSRGGRTIAAPAQASNTGRFCASPASAG